AARNQLLPRFEQAVDRSRATLMKALASTCERELAGGTLQQSRAEMSFELLDAATHGIGRQAQPPRRLCKAAAAHHLHKHGDVIEVEHGRPFLAWVDEFNPIVPASQSIGPALSFSYR